MDSDVQNIVILTGAGFRPRAGSRPSAGRTGCGKGIGSRMSRRPRPSRAIRRWCTHSTMRGGRGSATVEPNAAHRGAGAARRRMAGRAADRHPECRRPARARRVEAAAAHAWRADQRLVPGLRRAVRLGRADGRGRVVPGLRSGRAGPPRHRLVRRDALRDGADRRGAARRATCSCRSARRARSIPPPGFVQTARYCGARTLEINLEPSQGSIFFDESRDRAGGRVECRSGSRKCWA